MDYIITIMDNMDFTINCISKDSIIYFINKDFIIQLVFIKDNPNNHDLAILVIMVLDYNLVTSQKYFPIEIIKISIFFLYNKININKMLYKGLQLLL
jgi:hypothetical protein